MSGSDSGGSKSQSKQQQSKKALRKAENEQAQRAIAVIKAAYNAGDLLAPFEPFRKYDRNGLQLKIEFFTPKSVEKEVFEWMFELTKKNMQTMYEEVWGWSDGRKKIELSDDDALNLIAFDENRKPVGFINFRFVLEQIGKSKEKGELSYIFEMQIEPSFQGKGVGKFLMQIAELIARKNNMKGIKLTVFSINLIAQKFYKHTLKYDIDESSPNFGNPLDTSGFEVLCKYFPVKQS